MQPSERLSSDTQAELIRRHKATALTVRALLILTAILPLVAFFARTRFRQEDDPSIQIAVRIAILIFGLGSVVLRRRRFSAMRLQDIAALRGVSGLLATLANTTLQVALLGAGMAIFGFIATAITGNDFYAYGAGLVGLVVLLYCYPTRSSWERTVQRFGQSAAGPPAPPNFQTTE
jgi:hypothetical protein